MCAIEHAKCQRLTPISKHKLSGRCSFYKIIKLYFLHDNGDVWRKYIKAVLTARCRQCNLLTVSPLEIKFCLLIFMCMLLLKFLIV